jgi:hypothetical protein
MAGLGSGAISFAGGASSWSGIMGPKANGGAGIDGAVGAGTAGVSRPAEEHPLLLEHRKVVLDSKAAPRLVGRLLVPWCVIQVVGFSASHWLR